MRPNDVTKCWKATTQIVNIITVADESVCVQSKREV